MVFSPNHQEREYKKIKCRVDTNWLLACWFSPLDYKLEGGETALMLLSF